MSARTFAVSVVASLVLPAPFHLQAGPFPGAAGSLGSTAVSAGDSAVVAWASHVVDYAPGSNLTGAWTFPDEALGMAEGDTTLVVSLGRGGSITLGFVKPIADGPGFDFAVFENAFSDGFLELAFVEVSQDGVDFVRFPARSLSPGPVAAFQTDALDPTDIDGLAGKYRVGFGTPFDIGALGLDFVTQIRLVDVVGDGTTSDSEGRAVFDPYPTDESAGFDLDGIGVLNQAITFEGWLERHFSAAQLVDQDLVGGASDPDRDGRSNLVEYVLGGDPTDPSSRGMFTIAPDARSGAMAIQFTRSLLKSDVDLIVASSSSLTGWVPVAGSVAGAPFGTVSGSGAHVVEDVSAVASEVVIELPVSAPGMGFVRLEVSP